jgi:hypothetical protein
MTTCVNSAISLAIGAVTPAITIHNQSVSTTTAVARQIFSGIANSIRAASSLFGRVTTYVCNSLANTVTNTYRTLFGLRAPFDRGELARVYEIVRYVDREYPNLHIDQKIEVLQRQIDQRQASITDIQQCLRAVDERRSRDDRDVSYFALAKTTIQMKLCRILKVEKDLEILGRVIEYIYSNPPINHDLLNQALRKEEEIILYLENAREERNLLVNAFYADIESPDLSQARLRANKAMVSRVFQQIVEGKRRKLERLEKEKGHLILAKELFTTTERLATWFNNLELLPPM